MASESSYGSLYATGFNAFGQLKGNQADGCHSKPNGAVGGRAASKFLSDLRNFTQIASDGSQVLFACWSSTILVHDSNIFSIGKQEIDVHIKDAHMKCAIGDDDGMQACIDEEGKLWSVEEDANVQVTLNDQSQGGRSPRLGFLASAGNGRVVAVLKQPPPLSNAAPTEDKMTCQVHELYSFDQFMAWVKSFQAPRGHTSNLGDKYELPGRALQLQAGTGSFMLLTKTTKAPFETKIWTWGDNRFYSLGRSPNEATPADKPGIVDYLEGDEVQDIFAGGWISAALTTQGELYLWGSQTSQTCMEGTINDLPESGGDIVVAELPSGSDGDPLKPNKVAVGLNHVAVVVQDEEKDPRVLVTGDNSNGQVGLGDNRFSEGWTQIDLPASDVICGPKTTFLVCD